MSWWAERWLGLSPAHGGHLVKDLLITLFFSHAMVSPGSNTEVGYVTDWNYIAAGFSVNCFT